MRFQENVSLLNTPSVFSKGFVSSRNVTVTEESALPSVFPWLLASATLTALLNFARGLLFDCNRRLEGQVAAVSDQTAELVRLGKALENSQSIPDADKFVEKYTKITTYVPPDDIAVVLTTYSRDFQEWWREPRPNIKEW